MPNHMNSKWLVRQVEDISDDLKEVVVFDSLGEVTHLCLDFLTNCYQNPEDMNN